MENISESMQRWMDKKHLNDNYQKLMAQVYNDPDVREFLEQHQADLSEETIDRSSAKLYEYVNARDRLAAGKTVFAPGYQPALIINDHLIDVTYSPTAEQQEKMRSQTVRQRVNAVMMPKMIREANFDNFARDDQRLAALAAAADFTESYESNPKGFHKGLYLYGSFGVGKTYLLGAIANHLAANGFKTTLVHFPSFAVDMKNAIGDNRVAEKLDTVKKAPVLMLDDIGADSMSAWVRDEVLGVILEYRMQSELPTFFSSNFSMNQLETEHLQITQRGDEEPLKAKRLMQRIRFLASEIAMVGKNRRLD
ncbi:primosomal protein DnaI [Secundilactobacillus kimchicus]|nr:primosomal protein DnaI [Secundilactobacillus kimchicus]